MPEPQSLEEAFEPFATLIRRMGKARAQEAARNLALAVADEFAQLLHDPPLGQANCADDWTSDDDDFLEFRARIAALGEGDG